MGFVMIRWANRGPFDPVLASGIFYARGHDAVDVAVLPEQAYPSADDGFFR